MSHQLEGNLGVSLLYLMSRFRRREERHGAGVLCGIGGGLLAVVTGYLGGHLYLGRGVGNESVVEGCTSALLIARSVA